MLKVVEFPNRPACRNIPEALRELAQTIEDGGYEDAHNLVWATTAYFLLGLGKRRLEDV